MSAVSIEALHRSEGLRLQRYLLRTLGNPADAADATQETYLRLITALSRSHIERPPVFLLHVARNVALRMKRRQRFEARIFADVTDADLGNVVDGFALPERQVAARQELLRLAAAIDELPPRCREAFLLSRFDGFSNGEIAAHMGVSRSAIEQHLTKALLHCHRRCRELF